MSVQQLIAMVKALVATFQDPGVGYLRKLRAIAEFIGALTPLFAGEREQMFAAPPKEMTLQQAAAEIEALAPQGEGMQAALPLEAGGEWLQRVLALLQIVLPLVFKR